jgi:hypothetical protein
MDALYKLLDQHKKSWNDLPELITLGSDFLNKRTPKDSERATEETFEIRSPGFFDPINLCRWTTRLQNRCQRSFEFAKFGPLS